MKIYYYYYVFILSTISLYTKGLQVLEIGLKYGSRKHFGTAKVKLYMKLRTYILPNNDLTKQCCSSLAIFEDRRTLVRTKLILI